MNERQPITLEAARIRMADICARSEQCEADIKQKLYKLGLTSSQTAETINFLKENKFIDNKRFARSFSSDKCRFSSWGKYKIQRALAAKRLRPDEIAEGLSAIDENDYHAALMRTAIAKARTLDLFGESGRDNRMRLYRHIMARGFEPSLASEAVKNILRDPSLTSKS